MVAETIKFPNIRKMFKPDPGYMLIDVDLERADAQVVAWEADDEELKEIFRAGKDIHTENAVAVYKCEPENADKGGSESPRQKVKQGVHAANYDSTPSTLSEETGMTLAEATFFIKRWFELHPKIKNWHNRIKQELTQTHTVKNAFGFKRYFFDRIDIKKFHEALAWIPQCVPTDHEVLTLTGWKQIEKIDKTEAIAIWNNGKITFEVPNKWTFDETSELYHLPELGYYCTTNHRIPYFNAGREELQVAFPFNLPSGARVPRTGEYSGLINFEKAYITFIAAFQADGHYDKKSGSIQFELMKDRKINRLEEALQTLGVEYSKNIVRRNATTFYISKNNHGLSEMYKYFGAWLLLWDGISLDILLNEIEFWDGWRSPQGELWYNSKIKANCEWIATIAALRGKRARWLSEDTRSTNPIYRITIAPNKGKKSSTTRCKIKVGVPVKVGCPTVSSGFFLLRHNKEISVTGNSTVANCIDIAMANIHRDLPEVQLLLQVHDSLVMQAPLELCPAIYPKILSAMRVVVPYPDPLIIPVSLAASSVSWGDVEKPKGLDLDAAKIA